MPLLILEAPAPYVLLARDTLAFHQAWWSLSYSPSWCLAVRPLSPVSLARSPSLCRNARFGWTWTLDGLGILSKGIIKEKKTPKLSWGLFLSALLLPCRRLHVYSSHSGGKGISW